MGLTSTLVRALDRARSPRAVRGLVRALELTSGWKTADVMDFVRKSAVPGDFNTSTVSDWYARNGYRGIASLGGLGSFAGVSVTPDRAFEVAAFYACVKILSEDMASMPFFLYQKQGKDTRRATEQPLYGVLHDLANRDTAAGEFVEAVTAHAIVTGNGYARIERSKATGQVGMLWQIPASEMRMEKNSFDVPFYVHSPGNAPDKVYDYAEIFHLRGFTLDGLTGDNPLYRARHVLGLNIAQQEYAGRFFANDASPGIILERPIGSPALGPEATSNMKKAWVAWHQGLSKAHEPAILQEGTVAKRLDPDHQKLQLIEQRKFQLEEISRPLRVPLHRLMHLERMTFNNVEQLGIDYLTSALEPWRRRWKQAVHRCLLTPDERAAGYYAEHSAEIFLRGDFKTQWDGFARGLEKGVYSINDVRGYLNLNPVEGGDKHYVQLNMQDVASVADESAADASVAQDDDDAGVKALIDSANS